jgi:effector-binding domain-containing protein
MSRDGNWRGIRSPVSEGKSPITVESPAGYIFDILPPEKKGSKVVPAEADRKAVNMSHYDIVIKTIPAMLVAARRVTVPDSGHVPKYLEPAFAEAYEYVHRQGAQDNGPCLALWHSPGYVNEDAEAVIPIDRPLSGTDRVKVYKLLQTQVACLIHFGDLEEFRKDHADLLEWITANGYKIVGPYREIYMKRDRTITEIQFPVERA